MSDDLKKKISKEDVSLILDLEFYYQEKIGLVNNAKNVHSNKEDKSLDINESSVTVDGDKLNKYIITEAKKKGKIFTKKEVDAVLDGEAVYLEQAGLLRDEVGGDSTEDSK